MKRGIMLVLTVVFIAAVLGSCASVRPFDAGASGEVGSKVGRSEMTSILFFPPTGDAGIRKAAQNGGISKIGTVDMEYNWFFVGYKWTTIVTGE
jgi:hypothetical protein